jgi:YesN/AraC family two-component response regulator
MANILVVDDSAIMRRNLVTIFTQAGHSVVAEAINGGQAHLLYRTHIPDLVTMDITMPGVNGIEAVKLIIRDYPDAKIIMVSALNQRNMVFEALELGAKHYLIKPITPEAVISVVNKVLGIKEPAPSSKEDTIIDNADSIEMASQLPFQIENINNMFQIKLSKYLTEESFITFNQAVQGLLFVQPLIVIINFTNTDFLSDSLLKELSGVVKAIKGAKGTIKVVSQNMEFIKLVKGKKIEGLSELLETI